MPREPLYPHIPKRREPQFPHKKADNGDQAVELVPEVRRRVTVLAWRPPPPPKLAELKERLAARIHRRGRGHDVMHDEQAYIIERRLQGLTIKEIAEELGRGKAAIDNALREAGIGVAEVKERLVASKEIQEGKDKRDTMVQMRRAGFTLQQIGDRFGITKNAIRWHLYRAGEKIDLAEFRRTTTECFYKVSDTLRGPVSIPRMKQAADDLRDLIRDIMHVEQLLRPDELRLIRRPLEIRHLAEQARMVLLTGIWCSESAKEGVWTVEWRVTGEKVERVTTPILAAVLKRLEKCGPAAAEAARFIIEEVPGYVERAKEVFDLVGELEEYHHEEV